LTIILFPQIKELAAIAASSFNDIYF